MPRERKVYKYNFIYKTTNIKNGKFYIGMHSTNNLEDGYLGSGNKLRSSIRHYGKENHIREILEHFSNREDLAKRENEIITMDFLKDPMSMNISIGGEGGGDGFKKYRELLSKKEYREIVNTKLRNTTKKNWENGKYDSILQGFKYSFLGKSHSMGSKNKMSKAHKDLHNGNKNSQFGKIWITNSKIDKKISSNELSNYILEGWYKGRNKNCNIKTNKMENLTAPSLKDLIKNGNMSKFSRLEKNENLIYDLSYEGKTYEFSVPINDLGDATLPSSEKAITLMRYIRKAMDKGLLIEVPNKPLFKFDTTKVSVFSHYRNNVIYYTIYEGGKNYIYPIRIEDNTIEPLNWYESIEVLGSFIKKAKDSNEFHPC